MSSILKRQFYPISGVTKFETAYIPADKERERGGAPIILNKPFEGKINWRDKYGAVTLETPDKEKFTGKISKPKAMLNHEHAMSAFGFVTGDKGSYGNIRLGIDQKATGDGWFGGYKKTPSGEGQYFDSMLVVTDHTDGAPSEKGPAPTAKNDVDFTERLIKLTRGG